MRNLSITILLVTVFLAAAFSRAGAEESPLVGTWVNTNDETRACPRFEISINDEGTAAFVWWGKTGSTQTQYGPFPLSISSNGKSATAEHITKFSETDFTVKLRSGKVIMEMAIKYTDDSGRDDLELEEKFEKK